MRTTIQQLKNGNVKLSLDQFGERVTEIYTCPTAGGYIRTIGGSQVCEFLGRQGSTIRASSDTLLDVIRREYRRAYCNNRGLFKL